MRGRLPAGELQRALGVSRATLMRRVRVAGEDIIVRGSARRTVYAARRALRGSKAALPLYRVDAQGTVLQIARLDLTHPDGCAVEFLADFGWPLDEEMQRGGFDGLPYPLQDMRPQGFLGRRFARHHAALLQVPEDPTAWSDDHALHALSLVGADPLGDLILGEAACRRWLERVQAMRLGHGGGLVDDEGMPQAYGRLAESAMAQGLVGSSAGGEFPKFEAVRRDSQGQVRHMLVKFSGSDDAPGTRRWADLLVCEHLAGRVLAAHLGVRAVASRIHRFGARTFLEVERFDRHGPCGRSGVASWAAVNGALLGLAGVPWPEAARQLLARGWLTAQDAGHTELLWYFGQCIANNDMHDGNLSFEPAVLKGRPALRLAPAYDMLPMAYAPVRGVELPAWEFRPKPPLPAERQTWEVAARAALAFWQAAADDARISAGFRGLCAENAGVLRRLIAP